MTARLTLTLTTLCLLKVCVHDSNAQRPPTPFPPGMRPSAGGAGMPSMPLIPPDPNSPSTLLKVPKVQQELKLSSEQLDQLAEIEKAHNDELAELVAKKRRELLEQINGVLEDGQAKRLRGIAIQTLRNRALLSDGVVSELGITDDQKKKMQAVYDANKKATAELMQLVMSRKIDRTEFQRRGDALGEKIATELEAVLSETQRRKYYELRGAPFTVDTRELLRAGLPGR